MIAAGAFCGFWLFSSGLVAALPDLRQIAAGRPERDHPGAVRLPGHGRMCHAV
jgi:hypothetical protein